MLQTPEEATCIRVFDSVSSWVILTSGAVSLEERYENDRDRNRWAPSISMWLVSLISYIDRNTLAILAPVILRETHLNAEQYGFIVSCFSVAYMIGNPVWGIMLDRWGVRRGMSGAVGVWSIASAAHAWATGFWSFGIARAVLGAGEGATFPGGLRTVTQTLPPSKRGRGLAIAYSGGSLGAMITPLIVTPIAARFGWRGAFVFTGLLGASWLILWRFIGAGIDRGATEPGRRMLWTRLHREPAFWAFMAAYGIAALPLGFILYDSSLYLHARFGWSQTTLGRVLWIPPLGWETGYFFWGYLADRFGPRFKSLLFVSLLLSLPLAWIHSIPDSRSVLAVMFLTMFGQAGFVVLSVAYAVRAFPPENAGLIAGIGAGSWGAMVAVMMPWFGRMFDHADYAGSFHIVSLFPVAGYFLWLVLSSPGRRVPVPK
jgi:MFS transporter, ACS family, hexuronate transporter